jgi:hypothetical protein
MYYLTPEEDEELFDKVRWVYAVAGMLKGILLPSGVEIIVSVLLYMKYHPT